MDTLPMEVGLIQDGLAPPTVGEVAEDVNVGACAPIQDGDNGLPAESSTKLPILPRPEALDSLKPITPAEQRAALPKKKGKSKSSKDDVGDSKKDKAKPRTRKGGTKTSEKDSDKEKETEDSKGSKTKGTRRKKDDQEAEPKETKTKRTRRKKDDQEEEPKENKTKGTRRKKDDQEEEPKDESKEAEVPGKKRKSRKAASALPASTASGSGEGGTGTEAKTAEDLAAEKKKRASRRSSAYHKAKKSALAAGKSEQEAIALAKQVTGLCWIHRKDHIDKSQQKYIGIYDILHIDILHISSLGSHHLPMVQRLRHTQTLSELIDSTRYDERPWGTWPFWYLYLISFEPIGVWGLRSQYHPIWIYVVWRR